MKNGLLISWTYQNKAFQTTKDLVISSSSVITSENRIGVVP